MGRGTPLSDDLGKGCKQGPLLTCWFVLFLNVDSFKDAAMFYFQNSATWY